ncbi:MAG: hypothetical protein HY816_04390 [Candidatus Wallbacteria bacterium]|nr:hypothetical protein [Candidatus Wallbacteria bacterium]
MGVIALILMTAMLALDRIPRGTKPAPPPPADPAAAEPEEFLPLAEGNRWRYRSTTVDRRTGSKKVQKVEETVVRQDGESFRIVQEIDGRQADSRLFTRTSDGVTVLEYESARSPVLFLASGDLEPGLAWDIAPNRRARIEALEPLTVGSQEIDALKIRLERYYGREETDEPAWLPDGHFWVARGIGVVRRDSSSAKRPRVKEGRVSSSGGPDLQIDTLLELESYELATGDAR